MGKRFVVTVLATLAAAGAIAVSASSALAAPTSHAVSAQAAQVSHSVSARDVVTVPAAGTSTFFAYPKTGFSGTPTVVTGCGIHSLPAVGNSYSWVAHGQSGQMYNCLDAACGVNFTLSSNQDASQSTHVGWKSILIDC